jgi:outer membrane biosynthesis protein TonB
MLDLASPEKVETTQAKPSLLALLTQKMAQAKSDATLPSPPLRAPLAWNEAGFRGRQSKMDEKIAAVRRELSRLRSSARRQQAARSGGFRIVPAEERDAQWQEYLDHVRRKILEKWYPELVKVEGELGASEARIDFLILESGNVSKWDIVSWKGNPAFRDLCLASLKAAVPFEPVPGTAGSGSRQRAYAVSLIFYYQ